ncbi:DHA2 family multidrug resistance protein-like MFS transporter [Crossiella equi]|uniref:DHA2 family multidrug resistance protein-like MFS transporter n=1 Tax=Crossiella equi TaxID=130796 RepID=A0ABS5AQG6_9PSEU|nr:MFS transporter [Crossiella equi]MBP2478801.1 DHA2 family multidrug resistance protein-like MFS transporter [Crossiella equi]
MDTAATAVVSRRRWAVLVVLAVSLLLVAVDATVLHTAVPSLAADLKPGPVGLLWIIDVYSLLAAPLLIAFGTLGDRFGRRRVLMLGYVVFGLASVGAALATTTGQLIAARAALGIGGAMIMPATLSVLRHIFPDRKERQFAIGVWSAVAAAGAALGPLLGGVLVEFFSWHAAFLVNVPVMLITIPLALWLVPESADPAKGRWDLLSAALSALGVLGIAYGIKQAGHDGILDPVALVTFLGGLALLVLFVRRQLRMAKPLLDMRMFRSATFSTAVGCVVLVMSSLAGLGLTFSQYLQYVLQLGPLDAGIRLMPAMVAAIVGGLVAAPLLQRFSTSVVTAGGFTLTGLSLVPAGFWLDTNDHPWLLIPCLLGVGLGVSAAFTASSDALLASAPPEQAGAAAAVEETGYELGTGLGTAVVGTVMASVYTAHLGLVPGVPDGVLATARQSMSEAHRVGTELGGPAGEALLAAARTAFVDGLTVTLVISAVVLALAAIVASRLLPRQVVEAPAHE